MKMKNVVFPTNCIILPLHAKVVIKVVVATSPPSHHNNSSSYDCHILPFVDVKGEECIEHASDNEDEVQGIENNRSNYVTSMCSSTLNVLITLWTLICVCLQNVGKHPLNIERVSFKFSDIF